MGRVWLSTSEAHSIFSAFWLRSSRGLEGEKAQAMRALWREGRRPGGMCEEGQYDWMSEDRVQRR